MSRADVLRWGGARVRRWMAYVFAAVLACVVGLPWAPARAAGSVRIGSIRVDPAPTGALTANTVITFRATGTYTPDGAGDPSSLGFLWQFGDGTQLQVSETAGSGARNSVVTHTYARPGRYKVVCFAYHGTKFNPRTGNTTLDQHVDDFVNIRVFCEGYAPAAGKCRKGTFDAFDGVWMSGDARTGFTVTLDESKSKVRGTIEVRAGSLGSLSLPVDGKVRVKRALGGITALGVEGTAKSPDGTRRFAYQLAIELVNTVSAYRRMLVFVTELDVEGEPAELIAELTPAPRDDGYVTELCTTVGSSSQTVLPGGTFAYRFQLLSSGPACLPAGRIVVTMLVDGGTVVTSADSDITGFAAGVISGGLVLVADPLGDGPGSSAGRATATVVIRASEGADEVKITLVVADPGAAEDGKYALVGLPAPRVSCVTVDRPE